MGRRGCSRLNISYRSDQSTLEHVTGEKLVRNIQSVGELRQVHGVTNKALRKNFSERERVT